MEVPSAYDGRLILTHKDRCLKIVFILKLPQEALASDFGNLGIALIGTVSGPERELDFKICLFQVSRWLVECGVSL
jgi:hypothetical protein